jgi:hypothetical protein
MGKGGVAKATLTTKFALRLNPLCRRWSKPFLSFWHLARLMPQNFGLNFSRRALLVMEGRNYGRQNGHLADGIWRT